MASAEIIRPYPENDRFMEFYERLSDRLGDPDDRRCRATHADTIVVLNEMGADISASLAEVKKLGACCSCELMLNFPPGPNHPDDFEIHHAVNGRPSTGGLITVCRSHHAAPSWKHSH